MAANQKVYKFPNAIQGDSYEDRLFEILTNSVAVDLTGASIKMWLMINGSAYEYTTDNNKIVITDAEAGKFKIVFGVIDLPVGEYKYDIEITLSDGTVKTWITGTFTVLNDISK